MSKKCILKTEGYQIIFELGNRKIDRESVYESVRLAVEFLLDERLRKVSVKSDPSYIFIKDLRRLVRYFEQHITSLANNPNTESMTFLEYGLSFQFQAFSGYVDSENDEIDGSFTLLAMVDVGRTEKGAHRTYVGGESEVTVEDIQRFISSINVALTELELN